VGDAAGPAVDLLFGGRLFLFPGFGSCSAAIRFDYVINHLWLPLVLGLVVGRFIPELLSLVLMGDPARRPAPPSAVEKRRQRRQQVVRLCGAVCAVDGACLGLVWVWSSLPAMFRLQASFLGQPMVLMFTGAYVLSAVMTSGVVSVRRTIVCIEWAPSARKPQMLGCAETCPPRESPCPAGHRRGMKTCVDCGPHRGEKEVCCQGRGDRSKKDDRWGRNRARR